MRESKSDGSWRDLVKPAVSIEMKRLLQDWVWLVKASHTPLWMTAFGDMCFSDTRQQVFMLDTLEGSFVRIADSTSDIDNLLRAEDAQNKWLMREWVTLCKASGFFLTKDQCYGWRVAPVLGGKLALANIQVFDMYVYLSVTGQLHRQLKGLPDDYQITGIKMRRDRRE
jgi:hypothetical protein